MKKGEVRILNSKSMFNRCKLQRLVIEGSNEKDEIDIERIVNDMNGDEEHEEVGNGDKSLVSGTDSATMTIRGRASYNRRTQQNANKITRYYKFRGKR